MKFRELLPFIFLFSFSFLSHFPFLSYPPEVVFDEVHFGKFVSAYFKGEYYFDIHPPLGKLLIFGFAKIFNFPANFDFEKIGQSFNPTELFILRFLPALFGSIFPILIYQLILTMGFPKKTAFLAGFFFLFDNSFLTQSKFILLDIFLIFFGFLAIYFYLLAKKSNSFLKRKFFYLLSAISTTFSFSIKWTGFSFLAIIFIFILLELCQKLNFKNFLFKIVFFSLLPFLLYLSIFAIHFHLLKNSGPGNPFMSPAFQKSLLNNKISQEIKPLSFWQKFLELNLAMYKYNAGLKASHPNGSKFWEWPLMRKPIWYWNKNLEKGSANIYFLGNPLIWYLAIFSLIFSLFSIFQKKDFWLSICLFAFFLNFLPFIFVKRVTFLYSYLPALSFAILILAIKLGKFFSKIPSFLYFLFLILVFLFFILLSPLTFGLPVKGKMNSFYQIILNFLS